MSRSWGDLDEVDDGTLRAILSGCGTPYPWPCEDDLIGGVQRVDQSVTTEDTGAIWIVLPGYPAGVADTKRRFEW